MYAQIDWHDFVVVETVDFAPDERGLIFTIKLNFFDYIRLPCLGSRLTVMFLRVADEAQKAEKIQSVLICKLEYCNCDNCQLKRVFHPYSIVYFFMFLKGGIQISFKILVSISNYTPLSGDKHQHEMALIAYLGQTCS